MRNERNNTMQKRLLVIVLCVMAMLGGFAQSPADQINAIKQQSDAYLFAEYTSTTEDYSADNAKFLLETEIQNWLTANGLPYSDEIRQAVQPKMQKIHAMRGELHRIFYYVNKSDLRNVQPVAKAEQEGPRIDAMIGMPAPAPQPAEEPLYPFEDPKPAPSPVSTPTQEEPVAEVPAAEPEPAPAPQPAKNPSESVSGESEEGLPYVPSTFAQQMMTVTEANAVGPFILSLKNGGKVTAYGKYNTMPADDDCYLFVYNRELKVVAYLNKVGHNLYNLQTGKLDSIDNYKGCGAWWFQLN